MTSGFQLTEVEEDGVKRPRWALSIDDDVTNKLARRAWLELEIRLMSLDNCMSMGLRLYLAKELAYS